MKRLGLAFVVLVSPLCSVSATTVLQLPFSKLCQGAAFIFEGRVTRVEARQDNTSIHTLVTFTVVDRIKGPATGPEIELRFLGGTIGDMTMHVEEMRIPALGETGIYFVESLRRSQVHPLMGWSQGHFLVVEDQRGVRQIYTPDHKSVYAIDAVPDGLQKQVSTGIASGLNVGDKDLHVPLDSESFKKEIRSNLHSP